MVQSMKKLLLALALFLGLASGASAQCSGVFSNNTVCGNVTGANNTPRMTAISAIPITSAQFDILFGTTQGSLIYRNATTWVALTPGSAGNVLASGGAGANPAWTTAGAGTVTSITQGTGMSFSVTPCIATCTINIDKATSANLEAGTADKVLTADNIFDAEKTITFAGTQTWDFNTFLNARETLTNNITSLTCSNIKASQSGTISLVQDATGSRTMVAGWCSQFRWTGGSRGVLSTTAAAIDALFYQCISTSICYVSLGKAQAN